MKHSIHNIQHKAKKAIRQATVESEQDTSSNKQAVNYSIQYYNNFYSSRPSVHKSALQHFLKEVKRHKKMGSGKKHSKRTSPSEVSDEHPFTKMGHNPDYFIKHKQMKINEATNMQKMKARKWG